MEPLCRDRVCIVTGAGRGIGRAHAELLAEHGAKVVVNDIGAAVDGSGADLSLAEQTVAGIVEAGGTAVANHDDVADWEGAQRLVNTAIEAYGGLDVLVNNAGIIRDRVLVNMTEDEWDGVIRTHLKGTFATSKWAGTYWRERTKAGQTNNARIINTTSVSGLYGNLGQTNYGAAKAGIAVFTQIAATELGRYGVSVNAIAPLALTRMNASLPVMTDATDEARDTLSPRKIAEVAVWLASAGSADITGRVFEASGEFLAIAEGWHRGPTAPGVSDIDEIDAVARRLLAEARPNADIDGQDAQNGPLA
jgi:NAD(P)-dependent dehydrogenase (short-subunit alcohol dehydrogenase family)